MSKIYASGDVRLTVNYPVPSLKSYPPHHNKRNEKND